MLPFAFWLLIENTELIKIIQMDHIPIIPNIWITLRGDR